MAGTQADSQFLTNSFSDVIEVRPKDDQAIVFKIQKDIPNIVYADALNKLVDNEDSFLYFSRISGERICVVFDDAAIAERLVNKVRTFRVNDTDIDIKFLVEKAVKVIISNAGYGISNSALKKYLTNDCKIRTASSVSELKANLDSSSARFSKCKSFRRVVYIHPEDIGKLPKQPVRFAAAGSGFNVFFELDNPKCFFCGDVSHFKNSCPKLNQDFPPLSVEALNNDSNKATNQHDPVTDELFEHRDTINTADGAIDSPPSDSQSALILQNGMNMTAEVLKRPLPSSSTSTISDDYSGGTLSQTTQPALFATPMDPATKPKKVVRSNKAKKFRKDDEKSQEDIKFHLSSQLEVSRPYVEATSDDHLLNFDSLCNLIQESCAAKVTERGQIARKFTRNIPELLTLLDKIHGMVVGRSIKRKVTLLRKALDSDLKIETNSDLSLHSESESSDIN